MRSAQWPAGGCRGLAERVLPGHAEAHREQDGAEHGGRGPPCRQAHRVECRREWARKGDTYSYDQITQMAAQAAAFGPLVPVSDASFLAPGDMVVRIQDLCRKTGQRVPEELAQAAREAGPLWLAGGIGPANVGDVVHRLSPELIDSSSALEESPGRKDAVKLRRFFEEIRKHEKV